MKKLRLSTLVFAAAALVAFSGCTNSGAAPAGQAAAPAPFSTSVTAAYDAIATQATGFSVGSTMSANVAYVFFDPQCPHCAHLWEQSQPLVTKARLVWIPIGMLGRASAPQGATILGAPSPAEAMSKHEASLLARQGGISVNSDAVSRLKDKVDANTAFFNAMRTKEDGVPFLVTKVNGQVRSQAGSLSTAQLKQFLGLQD